MHTAKETDMLAAKMDLLMKRLDERAAKKAAMYGTVQAFDLQMTCKVCGNAGHTGNDCPETYEEASFINNGYCLQAGNGSNNQSRPPFQGGNSNQIRISIQTNLR